MPTPIICRKNSAASSPYSRRATMRLSTRRLFRAQSGPGVRRILNLRPVPEERFHFFANHLLAQSDLLLSLSQIIVGNRLKVIDVVEINIFQEVDLRLDVARHCDIDQKQRAIAAEFHDGLED